MIHKNYTCYQKCLLSI